MHISPNPFIVLGIVTLALGDIVHQGSRTLPHNVSQDINLLRLVLFPYSKMFFVAINERGTI